MEDQSKNPAETWTDDECRKLSLRHPPMDESKFSQSPGGPEVASPGLACVFINSRVLEIL